MAEEPGPSAIEASSPLYGEAVPAPAQQCSNSDGRTAGHNNRRYQGCQLASGLPIEGGIAMRHILRSNAPRGAEKSASGPEEARLWRQSL